MLILLYLPFFATAGFSQVKNDELLKQILLTGDDSLLTAVITQPDSFRYQIIYTQIDRDEHNAPRFKNYYLNVDAGRYFNPASMVKMPLAFLSLEKLTRLGRNGVTKYTTMLTDSSRAGQTSVLRDSSAADNFPSIAQYIRKAFLISDNDAYNRMYEFVGQQQINRRLHEMGYTDARITRRFARATAEQNRHTNAIRFVKGSRLLYNQPPAFNSDSFDFSHIYKMGRAHYNADDSLLNEPIDFTRANNLPLEDMQQILQAVMFPRFTIPQKRFDLSKDDYAFLYRFLSQYPSETNYPKYDTAVYYDSYVKFFFRDSTHRVPPAVRVFNKVGWAYGCLTDVAYVADFEKKIEFMLAVTIYVNSDGILNDNKYDYDSIGWPFLYKTGQAIYHYETTRHRVYRPNLSAFKMKYSKQKPDNRRAIKSADN